MKIAARTTPIKTVHPIRTPWIKHAYHLLAIIIVEMYRYLPKGSQDVRKEEKAAAEA